MIFDNLYPGFLFQYTAMMTHKLNILPLFRPCEYHDDTVFIIALITFH